MKKYDDLNDQLRELGKSFRTNFSDVIEKISAISATDAISATEKEQAQHETSNHVGQKPSPWLIPKEFDEKVNELKTSLKAAQTKIDAAQTKIDEANKQIRLERTGHLESYTAIKKVLDTMTEYYETQRQETEQKLATAINNNKKLTTRLTDTEAKRDYFKKQYETEQAERKKAEDALNDSKQSTQDLLLQRFRISKPDELPFPDWINQVKEQQGVWRWLQPALLGELSACEQIVKVVKDKDNDKDRKILELLHIDDLMQHWVPLVEKSYASNNELWKALKGVNRGFWLNRLLRANDLLQCYFPEDLKQLSQHLSNINGILRAAFVEMEIKFISPKILELVPSYITNKANINYNNYEPLLVELVNTSAKKLQGKVVVDIESYGFGENAETEVRVFAYNPSSWKE